MAVSTETTPQRQTPTRLERAEPQAPYLTDGVRLYRLVGKIDGNAGSMAAIEDCRSLEVILILCDELRDAGLRTVVPAASPATAEAPRSTAAAATDR